MEFLEEPAETAQQGAAPAGTARHCTAPPCTRFAMHAEDEHGGQRKDTKNCGVISPSGTGFLDREEVEGGWTHPAGAPALGSKKACY